jgi:hypothetical protein
MTTTWWLTAAKILTRKKKASKKFREQFGHTPLWAGEDILEVPPAESSNPAQLRRHQILTIRSNLRSGVKSSGLLDSHHHDRTTRLRWKGRKLYATHNSPCEHIRAGDHRI